MLYYSWKFNWIGVSALDKISHQSNLTYLMFSAQCDVKSCQNEGGLLQKTKVSCLGGCSILDTEMSTSLLTKPYRHCSQSTLLPTTDRFLFGRCPSGSSSVKFDSDFCVLPTAFLSGGTGQDREWAGWPTVGSDSGGLGGGLQQHMPPSSLQTVPGLCCLGDCLSLSIFGSTAQGVWVFFCLLGDCLRSVSLFWPRLDPNPDKQGAVNSGF